MTDIPTLNSTHTDSEATLWFTRYLTTRDTMRTLMEEAIGDLAASGVVPLTPGGSSTPELTARFGELVDAHDDCKLINSLMFVNMLHDRLSAAWDEDHAPSATVHPIRAGL